MDKRKYRRALARLRTAVEHQKKEAEILGKIKALVETLPNDNCSKKQLLEAVRVGYQSAEGIVTGTTNDIESRYGQEIVSAVELELGLS